MSEHQGSMGDTSEGGGSFSSQNHFESEVKCGDLF